MPVDLAGTIFTRTGGAPPHERPPARQRYRLIELERFSRFLSLPLNLHPAHFPVRTQLAARMIIAVLKAHGAAAANGFSGAVMSAVWRDEMDIASAPVLWALLERLGISAKAVDPDSPSVEGEYQDNASRALHVGVFGSPSYVFKGELFFGQDRLAFLETTVGMAVARSARGEA
jgi:carboxymethylenebutenolidase